MDTYKKNFYTHKKNYLLKKNCISMVKKWIYGEDLEPGENVPEEFNAIIEVPKDLETNMNTTKKLKHSC